ncbi:hypothetical protein [Agrobacterium tumefaciens]|uniref:hypothetical protein n=1 Tax=Agrobacterium tumefaciens TaxID=358 RepID=UPI00287C0E43|nr:hypothetical protein [Agrobacterium tumefaciens]MDS7597159.1 hypothetical protein [Agrobacterium tumefaciens]
MAIDKDNIDAALALLVKGFPERTVAFWSEGLRRVSAHHERRNLGSVGQLLLKGEDAVGVLLTLKSHLPGSDRTVVNLSSWYLEPSCRWFAPRMLQLASASPDETYTDLTPSPEAAKLNDRLGFKTVTDCTLFYPLPLKALFPSKASVVDLSHVPADAFSDHIREILSDHERLGCITAALSLDGRYHPLVFLKTTTKRLPSARLVFCEDRHIAQENIGTIARFLLAKGRLAMTLPCPEEEKNSGGFALQKTAKTQVKGEWNTRLVNETYSELVLLPL